MQLEFAPQNDYLLVRISGELDLEAADSFRRQIDAALDRHRVRNLYLNLSHVTFLDSSGLGAVLGRYRRVRQLGGRMGLISPSPGVQMVIELAGLHKIMDILESESALAG